jgi:hypothetical protein
VRFQCTVQRRRRSVGGSYHDLGFLETTLDIATAELQRRPLGEVTLAAYNRCAWSSCLSDFHHRLHAFVFDPHEGRGQPRCGQRPSTDRGQRLPEVADLAVEKVYTTGSDGLRESGEIASVYYVHHTRAAAGFVEMDCEHPAARDPRANQNGEKHPWPDYVGRVHGPAGYLLQRVDSWHRLPDTGESSSLVPGRQLELR